MLDKTAPAVPKRNAILKASPAVRRSVVIAGNKTNVSLENAFWEAFKAIAASKKVLLQDLVSIIDSERQHANLSSAIRVFVLDYYRNQPYGPPRIDPRS
jgi:predicted DNA-binding ribbon-helix-helix protein